MERAIRVLYLNPKSTALELEIKSNVVDGKVRKRLNDLRNRGIAKKAETRTCSISGRTAYTWVLTPKGMDYARKQKV